MIEKAAALLSQSRVHTVLKCLKSQAQIVFMDSSVGSLQDCGAAPHPQPLSRAGARGADNSYCAPLPQVGNGKVPLGRVAAATLRGISSSQQSYLPLVIYHLPFFI